MFSYECSVCHGQCDPGELENGICFECRSDAVQKQDERNCQTIRGINQLMHARYAEPSDGQAVMVAN